VLLWPGAAAQLPPDPKALSHCGCVESSTPPVGVVVARLYCSAPGGTDLNPGRAAPLQAGAIPSLEPHSTQDVPPPTGDIGPPVTIMWPGSPVLVITSPCTLQSPLGNPSSDVEVESPPWQKPKLPELGLTVTDSTSGAACTDSWAEADGGLLAADARLAPPEVATASVAAPT
jgi:hypothetical protein